ncbi:hypothetical protein ACU635_34045 [[Actinomadura] parvosata]|uniref:hypothetical protein n=1 Tax=[Actinomadura] parvosata TaxID=1955412 RepID=UPI00406CAE45
MLPTTSAVAIHGPSLRCRGSEVTDMMMSSFQDHHQHISAVVAGMKAATVLANITGGG